MQYAVRLKTIALSSIQVKIINAIPESEHRDAHQSKKKSVKLKRCAYLNVFLNLLSFLDWVI